MATYVGNNASMHDNACMYDNASIYDNASMYGNARMYDNARMHDNAKLTDTPLYGNALLSHDAIVNHISDYITLGPALSSGQYTTAFIDARIGIRVTCGCFSGTIEEFISAIHETHAENFPAKAQYLAFAACIRAHFAAREMLPHNQTDQ